VIEVAEAVVPVEVEAEVALAETVVAGEAAEVDSVVTEEVEVVAEADLVVTEEVEAHQGVSHDGRI
jgi:hypothetical protein